MNYHDTWKRFEPRFRYWSEFSMREWGFVSRCPRWWSSRFSDEFPWYGRNGFISENLAVRGHFDPIWQLYIAPKLGVYVGNTQLRLL